MLEEKLELARKGREEWLHLEKQYQVSSKENTRVLLYPDSQTEWNQCSLKYIEEYIKEYRAECLIILSYDEEILQNQVFESLTTEVVLMFYGKERAAALLAYYQLLEFTKQLTIVSLDKPEGRDGSNLLGVDNLTVEDVVKTGILRIGASGFNFDIGEKWKQRQGECNG